MTANLFGSRPRTTPSRKPYRLLLEPLEDRLTPSTYVVIGTADGTGTLSGSNGNFTDTTLRGAVNAANANPDPNGDTIILPASVAHYLLTDGVSPGDGGPIEITDPNLTIQGAGASVSVIDAGGTADGALFDNAFIVESGAAVVTFNGVTIENAHASGNGAAIQNQGATVFVNNDLITHNFASGFSNSGGGIANENNGRLTVTDSVLSDNQAGGAGGGIFNSSYFRSREQGPGSAATLQVINSTISGNTAGGEGGGGGLYNVGCGLATVTGSTFTGNTARGGSSGGAIWTGGDSTLSLVNDTIANNQAPSGGAGGGIFQQGSGSGSTSLLNVTLFHNTAASGAGGNIFLQQFVTLTLQNTIVAGSHNSGGNFAGGSGATVTSLGNNLEDANDLHLAGPGDLIDTDPGLQNENNPSQALQNNGGPTQTIALLAGSPAIDHASTVVFPATDQRGVSRPQGPAPDIGAFEFVPPPPAPPVLAQPASADLAVSMNLFFLPAATNRHRGQRQFTFAITITNNGPGTAFGAWYLNELPPGLDFVTVVTSQGTYVVAGRFLGVFLGDLPPGASVQIFLTVNARHGGRFLNTGQVFSQTPDPNPQNNSADLAVNVGIPLFESDTFNLVP